ncbi:hypothetical protein [Pseudomonas sp. B22129]|uniref:hypothetical protein n=1 Tax=Pseudomonas sp. B22129 TaxID=3235111 RepID=UPI003785072E
MSVPALETSVSHSSITDQSPLMPMPEAKASRHTSAALSFNGQGTANINFNAGCDHAGPVFGDHQRPADLQGQHPHSAHHNIPLAMTKPALQQGFMQQLQQLMSQWFGRPQSPGAGRPNPDYATWTNDQIGKALLDNFSAFTGSRYSKTMNTGAIAQMAMREPGSDPVMNQNIQLAKQLMRRPDLLAAFDRTPGTGTTDGRIDKQQLTRLLLDSNVFKYKTDKQIVQEMRSHYDQLESFFDNEITISDLRALATENLTGNPQRDHLIQLSRTVVDRNNLLMTMDNLFSTYADGGISKEALDALPRLLG